MTPNQYRARIRKALAARGYRADIIEWEGSRWRVVVDPPHTVSHEGAYDVVWGHCLDDLLMAVSVLPPAQPDRPRTRDVEGDQPGYAYREWRPAA